MRFNTSAHSAYCTNKVHTSEPTGSVIDAVKSSQVVAILIHHNDWHGVGFGYSLVTCSVVGVLLIGAPFQIVGSVIGRVLVDVVHLWQVLGVWHECLCHKSVYLIVRELSVA